MRVAKPGLLTTVQDTGRHGFQKYGVVVGGAMDAFALRAANLLVGNAEEAAGLEITMLGPELRWESSALISVCGGDLSPSLDGVPIPLWRTVYAPKGSVLRFGARKEGCRAYLAVAGGLDVPVVMNSRSTYLRAGVGGHRGRPLREGDRIGIGAWSARSRSLLQRFAGSEKEAVAVSPWYVSAAMRPGYSPEPTVRVVESAERSWFDAESAFRFYHESFTVLPQSDRMGYRLSGPRLQARRKQQLLSSAVAFGTIQVPADGNPIVLMADRQTTGGYPRIAQVITTDLPVLAQVPLGGKIRFRPVSLEEAQQRYVDRERAIETLKNGISIVTL